MESKSRPAGGQDRERKQRRRFLRWVGRTPRRVHRPAESPARREAEVIPFPTLPAVDPGLAPASEVIGSHFGIAG